MARCGPKHTHTAGIRKAAWALGRQYITTRTFLAVKVEWRPPRGNFDVSSLRFLSYPIPMTSHKKDVQTSNRIPFGTPDLPVLTGNGTGHFSLPQLARPFPAASWCAYLGALSVSALSFPTPETLSKKMADLSIGLPEPQMEASHSWLRTLNVLHLTPSQSHPQNSSRPQTASGSCPCNTADYRSPRIPRPCFA